MRLTITGPDGRRAVMQAPENATQEQIRAKAMEVKSRWGEIAGGAAATQRSPEIDSGRPGAQPAPTPASGPAPAVSGNPQQLPAMMPGSGGSSGAQAGAVATATGENLSPKDRVVDFVTGERRTEFPDAPEFLPAFMESRPRNEQGNVDASGAQHIMRSAVTPDPAAQLDILKKNIPDLESRTDKFGNIMLRAPGMTDFAYLNKPGISGRDVDEFGTQLLVTGPFARLFGVGGSVPARVATGALAGGGGSVTLDAAAIAQGSHQGIDPVRLGFSTAVGGALGPVLGKKPDLNTPRQEALEAAERVGQTTGIDVAVPRSVASDSRVVHATAGGLGSTLLGSPQQAASNKLISNLGEATESVARQYGRGAIATEFSGGSTAKEGIVEWITNGSKAIISKGYDALDKLIKAETDVPLSRLTAAVKSLKHDDYISASRDGQHVINLVREAVDRGKLTYAGLKELRTRIGERVFGDIAPEQGTSARALDRLYKALSEDLKFGVKRAGTAKRGSSQAKALAAFEHANTVARKTFARRDQLKKLVGAEADAAPERVLDRIVKMARAGGTGDLTKLAQARAALGDDWGEVASAFVAKLGRDADGNFSPALFIRDYGKLTKGAKNVLFSGKGTAGLKQALDDIATVSRKFKTTISRFQNTSLTGNTILATLGLGGVLAEPITVLGGAFGGLTLSFILSRPVTAKAAAHWSRAYMAAATSSNQAALNTLLLAGRQLVEAMRTEGITVSDDALQPGAGGQTETDRTAPRP